MKSDEQICKPGTVFLGSAHVSETQAESKFDIENIFSWL
jgi:hypothetical protein